ncbi:MAG: glycosyltransferase family 1 protein [Bacteroidetes bacterium]|jgi:phosphatidylinositol alpha 1,6-mannosyltransferase|nr:glycosyltransferase family 1 protein [Bacteroidota bacterium]
MKPLRVALFSGNYNHIRDGVALTLNRLVHHLEQESIAVKIFAPSSQQPAIVPHAGELIVTPSISMPVPGRKEYRVATHFPRKDRRELAAFNPDLIHIATPDGLGIGALKWAKKHKVPVVSSYHTHFLSYVDYYKLFLGPVKWPFKKMMQWFYPQCERTYVPTQSMIDELAREHIHGHMKIWARGIDTDSFNPKKRDEEWRRSVGIADDELVVSFVSRLVWEKELRTYIESVRSLQKEFPKVRAMVVGDGPAMKEAQKLLPNGIFTGFCSGDNLARAYASSDIFLFPSFTETFGNVTLEAMSSGLPCLVADAIGSRSLVIDGQNGFLAKAGDLSDFITKLRILIEDASLREQMAQQSRVMAMNYQWSSINQALVEDYYKVIDEYAIKHKKST